MSTATLTCNAFEYICKLVLEKSAIVLEPSKTYLVESRLNPVARANGMTSIEELVDASQTQLIQADANRCRSDDD